MMLVKLSGRSESAGRESQQPAQQRRQHGERHVTGPSQHHGQQQDDDDAGIGPACRKASTTVSADALVEIGAPVAFGATS